MSKSMSIKVKSLNRISNGKTLTSVKSAQFLYQSTYINILQQFWHLFHTWKKEILKLENWIKIDRERTDMKIVAGTTGVLEEPSGLKWGTKLMRTSIVPFFRTLVQNRTFLGKKVRKWSDFALKSLNLSKMEWDNS